MVQYPRESNWIGSLKQFNVLKITKIFIQHALRLRGRKTCGWIMLNMSLNLLEEYDSIKRRKKQLETTLSTDSSRRLFTCYRMFTIQPRQYSLLQWRTKAMRHTWHARAHMVEHGISTEPTHNTTHPIARNAMGYALSSNQSWVLFSQAYEKTLRTARWTPSIHSRHTYSTQRSHSTHLALEFPIQHGNFVRSSCLSSAKRSPVR